MGLAKLQRSSTNYLRKSPTNYHPSMGNENSITSPNNIESQTFNGDQNSLAHQIDSFDTLFKNIY